MDEDVIEERDGYRVRLVHDDDCEDPRAYEECIEIVGPRLRNWNVRTEDAEFQEAFDRLSGLFPRYMKIFHDTEVSLVYLYDHSSVALSAASFVGRATHARWDSSIVGYAYLKPDAEWKGLPSSVINSWVENLGQWMNGETYGYIVEKKEFWSKEYADPERADEEGWDWEEVDSCWGYIGYGYAEDTAREALGTYAPTPAENGEKR